MRTEWFLSLRIRSKRDDSYFCKEIHVPVKRDNDLGFLRELMKWTWQKFHIKPFWWVKINLGFKFHPSLQRVSWIRHTKFGKITKNRSGRYPDFELGYFVIIPSYDSEFAKSIWKRRLADKHQRIIILEKWLNRWVN